MAAEDARAGLRERWHADPAPDDGDRAEILRESIAHIDTQLERGAHAARRALEELEDELTAKRRHVRELLAELERGAA